MWQRLVRQHPGFVAAHTRLAEALQREGDLPGAAVQYRAAVALGDDDPTVEANYAWCVATDPQSTAAQIEQVLPTAQDAAERTRQQDPLTLDAWAATLARAGQFDEATRIAKHAAAAAASEPTLARAIAARAAVYGTGRPYLIHSR
jgi:Tfp pilus assembly protein PilF